MTHVVTENCIQCKYTDCVDVCPVDLLSMRSFTGGLDGKPSPNERVHYLMPMNGKTRRVNFPNFSVKSNCLNI